MAQQMLHNALRQFYQKASRDGCIQVAEIQQCCGYFNVNIDQGTAMQLLVKLAGRDQRLTENEFANGMTNFLIQNLGPQLRNFYQRACADGVLQIAEMQQVMGMFGCPINPQEGQQLLFRIAGRDQRITENEFVHGILAAVGERKMNPPTVQMSINMPGMQMGGMQQPQMNMGMGQMGMQQQMMPQMNMGMQQQPMSMMQPGCMQMPYMAGQAMMGGLTPEQMQLKNFFAQACADGMIQVQEVMQACMMYGVPIDQMTAQQLIQQIAGADRRITETEFVTGISTFCQQRKMMQQQMMQQQMGMMGQPGMMPMMPM